MLVGDWQIEGWISVAFCVFFIFNIFANSVVIIWLASIIYRELKDPAIDLFKIIQPVLATITFINFNFGYLRYFWYQSADCLAIRLTYVILMSSLYLFYTVNIFSFYLIIFHVQTLHQLRSGVKHQQCRSVIRAREIKTLIVVTILEIAYIVINALLTIFSWYKFIFIVNFDWIIDLQLVLIYVFLSVCQFNLCRKLYMVMQSDLNYYFKHKWAKLRFMARINGVYFFILIFWSGIFAICQLDVYRMIGMYNPYNGVVRILFLLSYFIANSFLCIFIISNLKVINFKNWIFDILSGYKLIQFYKQHSIFIASNKCMKSKKESQSILSGSDEDSLDSNALSPDYEVNDDYMKSYKQRQTQSSNSELL